VDFEPLDRKSARKKKKKRTLRKFAWRGGEEDQRAPKDGDLGGREKERKRGGPYLLPICGFGRGRDLLGRNRRGEGGRSLMFCRIARSKGGDSPSARKEKWGGEKGERVLARSFPCLPLGKEGERRPQDCGRKEKLAISFSSSLI